MASLHTVQVLNVFCFLFITLCLVEAGNYRDHSVSAKKPCRFKIDKSTTETRLRTAILLSDVETAAEILSTSTETFSLAAGLTYTPEQQCFIIRSQNRSRDPDIVAAKALAMSAERTGDTQRLSSIIVASFQLPCQCSLFTPRELDEMRLGIKTVLDDPVERQLILDFDGTEEEPVASPQNPNPPVSPSVIRARRVAPATRSVTLIRSTTPTSVQASASAVVDNDNDFNDDDDFDDDDDFVDDDFDDDDGINDDDFLENFGRRLLLTESSPTNSNFCAYCQPGNTCKPVSWCPK